MIQLQSTITCPECGHRTTETMPIDSCQYFYECPQCETFLKPKRGDCCVFCSYGDVQCPAQQTETNSTIRDEYRGDSQVC